MADLASLDVDCGNWAEQGAVSCAHWRAWRCALTPDLAEFLEGHADCSIDASTCEHGLGERLDLAAAVDWILEIERWAPRRARAAPDYALAAAASS